MYIYKNDLDDLENIQNINSYKNNLMKINKI